MIRRWSAFQSFRTLWWISKLVNKLKFTYEVIQLGRLHRLASLHIWKVNWRLSKKIRFRLTLFWILELLWNYPKLFSEDHQIPPFFVRSLFQYSSSQNPLNLQKFDLNFRKGSRFRLPLLVRVACSLLNGERFRFIINFEIPVRRCLLLKSFSLTISANSFTS